MLLYPDEYCGKLAACTQVSPQDNNRTFSWTFRVQPVGDRIKTVKRWPNNLLICFRVVAPMSVHKCKCFREMVHCRSICIARDWIVQGDVRVLCYESLLWLAVCFWLLGKLHKQATFDRLLSRLVFEVQDTLREVSKEWYRFLPLFTVISSVAVTAVISRH